MALHCLAIFILVFLRLAKCSNQNVYVVIREPPFGRDNFVFPYPQYPARTAVIIPAPALTIQGTIMEPTKNSKVDFRQKQPVYVETETPTALEGLEFLCKPGSTLGNLIFSTFQKEFREDFLCNNAISYFVENKTSNSNETVMLVDLKDGDDEVYLGSQPWATRFLIGNSGKKIFHSDQLYNEFRLNSFCNGTLTGEIAADFHSVNFITVSGNCSRGKELNVNLIGDNGTVIIGNNVNLSFNGMKAIFLDGLTLKNLDWVTSKWNFTLVHNHDGWVTIGRDKASGQTAMFCGAENLSWENKLFCTYFWQTWMCWIVCFSVCLPVGLLFCLVACICVKTKRNRNAHKACETVKRTRNFHLPNKQ